MVPTKTSDKKSLFSKGTMEHLTGGCPSPLFSLLRKVWGGLQEYRLAHQKLQCHWELGGASEGMMPSSEPGEAACCPSPSSRFPVPNGLALILKQCPPQLVPQLYLTCMRPDS